MQVFPVPKRASMTRNMTEEHEMFGCAQAMGSAYLQERPQIAANLVSMAQALEAPVRPLGPDEHSSEVHVPACISAASDRQMFCVLYWRRELLADACDQGRQCMGRDV
jgi:hypothetical protein